MAGGRPSVTARWVAAHRIRLAAGRPSTPAGDPAADLRLARAVAGAFALPLGTPTGMAERTRFVDEEIARAVGAGVRQFVLVGAGYYGRALRFGGPDMRWFEVDRASTQDDKRTRLRSLGIDEGGITFVRCDLMTEDIGEALVRAGHDPTRPTLFVCEGLFSYLPLGGVATLCESLRARSPEGSTLVASFLVTPETGATGRALHGGVDLFLRAAGERRRSEYQPGDPHKLLVVTGWTIARTLTSRPRRVDSGSHVLLLAADPAPVPGDRT